MIRQPISRATRIALGIVAVLVVIAGYGWLSYQRHQINPKDTTIPNASQFAEGWWNLTTNKLSPPQDSRERLHQFFFESWLAEDVRATYGRLFAGMAVGVLLSLVVGLAMGCLTPVEAFCAPPLSFFAKIPPTAMLAVYFVVFGTELRLYVAMIALGIFPILAQAIYQSARKDVTEHAIDKAYTLGASHFEVVWNVVLRQVLPRIIESIRLQIGPAMIFLIAAEYLVGDVGFGYRLKIQSRILHMNVVYVYLVILGVTGLMLDWLLSTLRRKLCPWFGD
jgi:NitT/TauT family transport system permease protein